MLTMLSGATVAVRYIAFGIAIFYPLSIVFSLVLLKRKKHEWREPEPQHLQTPHYRCWSETGPRGIVSDLPE